MELYLIRHGQSANNVIESAAPGTPAALGTRHRDPELTAKGEEQASRVATFIATGGHLLPEERHASRPMLDRLYCSAMVRALHTAQYLGRALGMRPEVWVEVHEMGGIYLDEQGTKVGYPGQGAGQIRERFPETDLPPQVTDAGWWRGGYEEEHQAQGRAIGVARRLRAMAGQAGRVGVVSHGDFLNALLKALEDHLPGSATYWEHRNTGITRIDIESGGRQVLRYLNRVEHLPAELLSRG